MSCLLPVINNWERKFRYYCVWVQQIRTFVSIQGTLFYSRGLFMMVCPSSQNFNISNVILDRSAIAISLTCINSTKPIPKKNRIPSWRLFLGFSQVRHQQTMSHALICQLVCRLLQSYSEQSPSASLCTPIVLPQCFKLLRWSQFCIQRLYILFP